MPWRGKWIILNASGNTNNQVIAVCLHGITTWQSKGLIVCLNKNTNMLRYEMQLSVALIMNFLGFESLVSELLQHPSNVFTFKLLIHSSNLKSILPKISPRINLKLYLLWSVYNKTTKEVWAKMDIEHTSYIKWTCYFLFYIVLYLLMAFCIICLLKIALYHTCTL